MEEPGRNEKLQFMHVLTNLSVGESHEDPESLSNEAIRTLFRRGDSIIITFINISYTINTVMLQ